MFAQRRRAHVCIFFGLLLASQLISGCESKETEARFDQDAFANDKYHVVVCFDLRDDDRPTAGLLVRSGANRVIAKATPSPVQTTSVPGSQPTPATTLTPTPTATPSPEIEQHLVVLPFGSLMVQGNRRLLSTWASYNDVTLLTYVSSHQSQELRGIAISPVFGSPSDSARPIESRRETIYLDRSGLERTFFYRYPPSGIDPNRPAELQSLPIDIVDAIAVAIPSDAKGLEIRDNQTAIPRSEFANSVAKFYPANSQAADSRFLEVRYAVEASKPAKILADVILKLLAVLLVPTIELFLLGPADIFKPRVRMIVMYFGLALQLVILGVLIWIASSVRGELGEKAITELPVIVVGALFAGFVLYIKRKPAGSDTKTN